MPSATLVGGQAPQQIAGSNTDPVVIRNLSTTANVYLGFETSVSPATAEMVMLPGELYRSPGGSPVYVCTDPGATAAILYNTSGTGVDLAGPTQVATTAQQSLEVKYNQAINLPAPNNRLKIMDLDASNYQALKLIFRSTGTPPVQANGMIRIIIGWKDKALNYYGAEAAVFTFTGTGVWTIPVKGPIADINIDSDVFMPSGLTGQFIVLGTTLPLKEEYLSQPGNLIVIDNGAGNTLYQYTTDVATGKVIMGKVETVTTGSARMLLPASYSGRIKGSLYTTGQAVWRVKFGAFGVDYYNYENAYVQANLNLNSQFDLISPKAPMFLEHALQGGSYGRSEWALYWE